MDDIRLQLANHPDQITPQLEIRHDHAVVLAEELDSALESEDFRRSPLLPLSRGDQVGRAEVDDRRCPCRRW